MIFILSIWLLPLLLIETGSQEVNLLPQFSESNAKFAVNLYNAVVESRQDENIIISPFSVHICGALLYSGAAGATAEELAKRFSLSQNNSSSVASSFREALKSHKGEHLQIANKMYLKPDLQVKEDFLKTARNDYFSDEENVDFSKGKETAEIINNWVKNATHNKIQELFKESDFNERPVMALVNTIYFKEKWRLPFEHTFIRPFWVSANESKDIDMMYLSDENIKFMRMDALDARAIQLDYDSTTTSMLIVLPNNRTGLKNLEDRLSEVDLIELQSKMVDDYVNVMLPKFHIDSLVNLRDTFRKMEITSIFEDGADFSNMIENRPIKVDKAVHKAFIDVTETGTEAGAATGFGLHDYSLPISFVAEHPFLFAVVSKRAVLFLGRYVK